MKTPMQLVKERFGSKDKLVDEILGLLKKSSDLPKEQLKKKLQVQSNKKLLVLLDREKKLSDKFGSRDQLIDALMQVSQSKGKDKDFRKHFARRSTGQLLDLAWRKKLLKAK